MSGTPGDDAVSAADDVITSAHADFFAASLAEIRRAWEPLFAEMDVIREDFRGADWSDSGAEAVALAWMQHALRKLTFVDPLS